MNIYYFSVLEDECIGKENVFSVLLDHGANINATDVYGLTALRYAAQKGLVDALAILLKNPALEIEVRKDRLLIHSKTHLQRGFSPYGIHNSCKFLVNICFLAS